jgi:hypothetical protein
MHAAFSGIITVTNCPSSCVTLLAYATPAPLHYYPAALPVPLSQGTDRPQPHHHTTHCRAYTDTNTHTHTHTPPPPCHAQGSSIASSMCSHCTSGIWHQCLCIVDAWTAHAPCVLSQVVPAIAAAGSSHSRSQLRSPPHHTTTTTCPTCYSSTV